MQPMFVQLLFSVRGRSVHQEVSVPRQVSRSPSVVPWGVPCMAPVRVVSQGDTSEGSPDTDLTASRTHRHFVTVGTAPEIEGVLCAHVGFLPYFEMEA